MNLRIRELAKMPRGRRDRSRLIAYDADIQRMRKEQVSYEDIAAWISDRGLTITGSGVHRYVRVRVRRGSTGYQPSSTQLVGVVAHNPRNHASPDPITLGTLGGDGKPSSPKKEFVYNPPPKEDNPLDGDDLSFNDPSHLS